jgi:hypothetical protein
MVKSDKLIRSIRLVDNIKVEIYQQGNKRKYGLIWKPVNGNNYDINIEPPLRTDTLNIADSDDTIIEAAVNLYINKYAKSNLQQSQLSYYKIVQDPFIETLGSRNYGSDKSPYFLNNGCSLIIEWIGSIPNPSFELGTYSTPQDAYNYNISKGIHRWLKDQSITSTDDDGGKKIKSKWVVPTGMFNASNVPVTDYRDEAYITGKKVIINFPTNIKENGKYLIWSKKNTLEYDNVGELNTNYFSNLTDSNIISSIITEYKNLVKLVHGIGDYDLKLCSPDTTYCSLIEYKSPIQPPEVKTIKEVPLGPSSSTVTNKVKLTIDGLPDDIQVKEMTNLQNFTVWAGPIPKSIELSDDFEDLAEYTESGFSGDEEGIIIVDGKISTVFNEQKELTRNEDVIVSDRQGDVSRGGSEVKQPESKVSTTEVILPYDLKSVKNSSVITKQSTKSGFRDINLDIIMPSGESRSGESIAKYMNEFVTDVLGPFATFLKKEYPDLYKNWYITSATRGYVPNGGSLTSQHMKGQAIDSQILGATAKSPGENIKLLNAILTWYKYNPVGYGQILFETRGSSCWIHWSYSRGNTKLQLLRFREDKTYSAGVNTSGSYVQPPVTSSALGFSSVA